jgi:hypothetical protein
LLAREEAPRILVSEKIECEQNLEILFSDMDEFAGMQILALQLKASSSSSQNLLLNYTSCSSDSGI